MRKIIPSICTVVFSSFFIFPTFVLAQANSIASGATSFASLVDVITNTVVKSLSTLFISLALLAFFWGIVEYVWARRKGDTKGVEDGNKFMTWGLIALFVMFSVYGIIKLSQSILFGGRDVTSISIPSINLKASTGADMRVGSPAPLSPGGTNGGNYQPLTPGGTNGGSNSVTGGQNVSGYTSQASCLSNSGIWQNGECINAQQYCTSSGGIWMNDHCGSAQEYCTSSGGIWSNGSCGGAQQYCTSNGGIWMNDHCGSAQEYCASNGGVWQNDSCGSSVSNNQTEVTPTRDVSSTCTDQGGTLRDDGSCEILGGLGDPCTRNNSRRCSSGYVCDGTIGPTYLTCQLPDPE